MDDQEYEDFFGLPREPEDERASRLVEVSATFLDDLKSRREELGLSVEEVAQRLETAIDEVAAFENGVVDPRLSDIQRYCLAVGIDISLGVENDHENSIVMSKRGGARTAASLLSHIWPVGGYGLNAVLGASPNLVYVNRAISARDAYNDRSHLAIAFSNLFTHVQVRHNDDPMPEVNDPGDIDRYVERLEARRGAELDRRRSNRDVTT